MIHNRQAIGVLLVLAGIFSWSGLSWPTGIPAQDNRPGQVSGTDSPGPLSNAQRLDRMSAVELERIRSRKQRIEELPEPARQRLWEIHKQWTVHPERDELLKTMRGYYEWWKTLSDDERTRIKLESGSQRLEVVRQIMQQRAEAIFGLAGETQLPREDVSALFAWANDFLTAKRDQIIELYRSNSDRRGSRRGEQRLEQTNRPESLYFILNRLPSEQAGQLILVQDMDALKSKLSADAVAIIDAQDDESARQKLVCRWLISAINAQWNPTVPERELMDFYDLEMTQSQRQMVDALNPERRRAAIAQMYRARRRNAGGSGFPPFGFPSRQQDVPDADEK